MAAPSYSDETIVWQGSPSQWLNLGNYIFYGFLWSLSPTFVLLWHGLGYQYSYSEHEQLYQSMVLAFAIMPPCFLFWAWLKLKCERITITKNKITEASGVSAIFRDEKYCEIADVYDIKSPPAGLLALVGRASLVLLTRDEDQPVIKLRAIKNRDQVKNMLFPLVRELTKDRKTYFKDK